METLKKNQVDEERHQKNVQNTSDCETFVLETDSELGVNKAIVIKRGQSLVSSTPKHNYVKKFYSASSTELSEITNKSIVIKRRQSLISSTPRYNYMKKFYSSSSTELSEVTDGLSDNPHSTNAKYNTARLNKIPATNGCMRASDYITRQRGTYSSDLNRCKHKKYITNTVQRKLNKCKSVNVTSLEKKIKRLQAMLKVTLEHENRRRKCLQDVDLSQLQARYDAKQSDTSNTESKLCEKSMLQVTADDKKCSSGNNVKYQENLLLNNIKTEMLTEGLELSTGKCEVNFCISFMNNIFIYSFFSLNLYWLSTRTRFNLNL